MTTNPTGNSLISRLNRWPRWLFALVVGALAVMTCAFFFPPRIEVWARHDSRQQEWSRADSFLKQCQAPLSQEVEPALRWRLLPPLLCHLLGLQGRDPLALCWLGTAGFAVALAARLERLTASRWWAALGAVGFATTGPFITDLGWLGLNDGWYLLALLETTVGSSSWGVWAWAFVGPWIDERFLFGLPLALFVRIKLHPPDAKSIRSFWLPAVAGVAPYLLFRVGFSLAHGDGVSGHYVRDMIGIYQYYLPYVPLGWLMGYRVGLVVLLVAFVPQGMDWNGRLIALFLTFVPLIAISMLAWDLDRSTGILLPLYVFGVVVAAQASARPPSSRKHRYLAIAAACLAANLALPYAHIVGPTVSWNRGPLGIWTKLADR